MLHHVTKVVRTEDPFPASPMGFSGEVMVQGEVHPPPRIDVKTGNELDIIEDDYIVPPWTAVFQVVKSRDEFSSDYATMDAAIEGDVPHIFANFRDRSFNLVAENGLRFGGVTPDGVADAEAAEEDPLGSGRTALVMHGSTTMACWRKPFEGAHLGQLVEYLPVDCGWAPDGFEKFSTCLFRPVDLNKIARTSQFIANDHHRSDNVASLVFSNGSAERGLGELHALFPYLPESAVIVPTPGVDLDVRLETVVQAFVADFELNPLALDAILPSDFINKKLMKEDIYLGRENAESMWVTLLRAFAGAKKPRWEPGNMYVKSRYPFPDTTAFTDAVKRACVRNGTFSGDSTFFNGVHEYRSEDGWYYARAAMPPGGEQTVIELSKNQITVGWSPGVVNENRKLLGFEEVEFSEDLIERTFGSDIKSLDEGDRKSLWAPASQWRYRDMIFRAMAENHKRTAGGEVPMVFDSLYGPYALCGSKEVTDMAPWTAKVTYTVDRTDETVVVSLSEAITLACLARDFKTCVPDTTGVFSPRDHRLIKTSASIARGIKRRAVAATSATTGPQRRNHYDLEDVAWEKLKEQLDQIPVDPQRIIGEFVQATRGENEIRVLLRKPHIF